MDNLTCTEIEELLPGFVLDGPDQDERLEVALHLAECRNHDAALADLRKVLTVLPEAMQPIVPPQSLRARVLQAVNEDAPAPAMPRVQRSGLSGLLGNLGFAYGLAAAFLVLAIGLGALTHRGGQDVVTYSTHQNNQVLEAIYVPDKNLSVLHLEMPALPTGRVYQAWQIVNNTPFSLGIVGNEGWFAFQSSLRDASAVALSVEPPGGSDAPTSAPVIVADRS